MEFDVDLDALDGKVIVPLKFIALHEEMDQLADDLETLCFGRGGATSARIVRRNTRRARRNQSHVRYITPEVQIPVSQWRTLYRHYAPRFGYCSSTSDYVARRRILVASIHVLATAMDQSGHSHDAFRRYWTRSLKSMDKRRGVG